MNGPALKGGPPRARSSAWTERGPLPEIPHLRGDTIVGHVAKDFAVEAGDVPPIGSTKPRSIFNERLENRLEIKHRPADDLQDLAGRRLLLEGLGQLTVARAEFREQAHILDGDDRLVGEGLEQLDLLRGEGAGLGPTYGDRADGIPLAEHRDDQDAPDADGLGECRIVIGVEFDIGDVYDRS